MEHLVDVERLACSEQTCFNLFDVEPSPDYFHCQNNLRYTKAFIMLEQGEANTEAFTLAVNLYNVIALSVVFQIKT